MHAPEIMLHFKQNLLEFPVLLRQLPVKPSNMLRQAGQDQVQRGFRRESKSLADNGATVITPGGSASHLRWGKCFRLWHVTANTHLTLAMPLSTPYRIPT